MSSVASFEFENLDPRKRRTRVALQAALEKLLEEDDFEGISVGDIADSADLNRATFYAHYPDKFALLECMVGSRFNQLLEKRHVSTASGCKAALSAITLAVYDYLVAKTARGQRQHQLEPHLEAAVISAVRRMMLDGLERHAPARSDISREMIAGTVSWAIYGAAKEWFVSNKSGKPDELVKIVATLIGPILEPVQVEPIAVTSR